MDLKPQNGAYKSIKIANPPQVTTTRNPRTSTNQKAWQAALCGEGVRSQHAENNHQAHYTTEPFIRTPPTLCQTARQQVLRIQRGKTRQSNHLSFGISAWYLNSVSCILQLMSLLDAAQLVVAAATIHVSTYQLTTLHQSSWTHGIHVVLQHSSGGCNLPSIIFDCNRARQLLCGGQPTADQLLH